jgi:hypothetical protein
MLSVRSAGFVRAVRYSAGTPARSNRTRSLVELPLYAGNNLEKARTLLAKAIKHRPKIRLTIRQRPRVFDQYPK